ncbi:MAG: hypothetical protein ACK2UH_02700 [Candidatus Promineifilaceae bacterium]
MPTSMERFALFVKGGDQLSALSRQTSALSRRLGVVSRQILADPAAPGQSRVRVLY